MCYAKTALPSARTSSAWSATSSHPRPAWVSSPDLPTKIIPAKTPWLKTSGIFPMDLRIPSLKDKMLIESTPLKSRILVRRLAVPHTGGRSRGACNQVVVWDVFEKHVICSIWQLVWFTVWLVAAGQRHFTLVTDVCPAVLSPPQLWPPSPGYPEGRAEAEGFLSEGVGSPSPSTWTNARRSLRGAWPGAEAYLPELLSKLKYMFAQIVVEVRNVLATC